MIARLPSLTLIRLLAALLLATIGLQATAQAAPSPEKQSGSAFSAATFEVALHVVRGEREQRQAVAPQPLARSIVLAHDLWVLVPMLADKPAPRSGSTEPPPSDVRSRPPAPRAPPLS